MTSQDAAKHLPGRARPVRAVVVLAGLAASAAATAVAPAFMLAGYSWISLTTSEAAAQAVSGGWMGRLGFLLFGLSVLLLADVRRRPWGPWGTALHVGFGALMTAAAAFSHRPWSPELAFDRTEDLLHSVAASAMGFAFAAGVVAVALRTVRSSRSRVGLHMVAVAASVAVPIAMAAVPSADGLLQRLMFGVAYAWYAAEAARGLRREPVPRRADGGRRAVPTGAPT
jgi:hypothetical protein